MNKDSSFHSVRLNYNGGSRTSCKVGRGGGGRRGERWGPRVKKWQAQAGNVLG